MTREEEIRQEMSKIAGTHPDWSKNDCMRMGFHEGAKWADKTMIEKFSKRIESTDIDMEYWNSEDGVCTELLIEDFKKAMES